MTKKLVIIFAFLVTLIGVGVANAQTSGTITFTDPSSVLPTSANSLTIPVGDTGPHTIKVSVTPSLLLADSVTLKLVFDSKRVQVSPTQLTFSGPLASTPGTSNPQFTFTLTNTARTDLKATPITLSGTSAVQKISYSGTFTVHSQLNSPSATTPSPSTTVSTGPAGFDAPLVQKLGDPTGFVYKSWRVVRLSINSLLIIALLLISFSNILRINIDTYTVKKALPNLIIGVILANASFLIVKYMADIASVATYFFVGLQTSDAPNTGQAFTTFFSNALAALGIDSIKTVGVVAGLASPILVIIFALIAIVLILWLAFLLYFRLVAIYLLTILAPLAFVAYGIPGFEKYFKQWWQQFVKWLFILPAMCAVFWLMLVIHNASDNNNSIASLIIMYILFFLALSMPSKMGGAVIDRASKAFQKYSGVNAAKKYASDEAGNAGKWALSKTPGVYRIQEWNKLRKENFEKDLATRRKVAGVKARGGTAGLREGTLGYKDSIAGNFEAERKAERSEKALTARIARDLNASDIKKTAAEKYKERKQIEERIKFLAKGSEKVMGEDGKPIKDANGNDVYVDPTIRKIINNFSEATSRSSALSEAVKTQETIITGDYTNPRLGMLKRASQYRKELDREEEDKAKVAKGELDQNSFNMRQGLRSEVIAQLTTAFNEDKMKHPALAGESIEGLAAALTEPAQKAILENEMKKQAASFNAGIDGQMKDMRESGSVRLLMEENKDQLAKLGNIMEKIASGRTAGVNMGLQRDFETIINPLKYWMRSNRDPNYTEAIKKSLDLLVRQGKQELKFFEKGSNTATVINSNNVEEYLSGNKKIEGIGQEKQRSIVTALNQTNLFSGSSAQHVAGVPETPDVPPEPAV